MTSRPIALRHLELEGRGKLVCTKCARSSWCKHIETAIIGGYDEPTIWHSGRGDHFIIRVPMIPTQNMYADCMVDRTDSTRPYRLYLDRPDKPENEYGIDLGITGPGEALKVWRLMIWDYFTSVVPPNQKCQGRSHSFQAQNKLAADLRQAPTEPAPRAQIWCMWWHKMCLSCHDERNMLFESGMFVPDDKKPGWNNLAGSGLWTNKVFQQYMEEYYHGDGDY